MAKPWMSELILKKLGVAKCNGSVEAATENLSMPEIIAIAQEKSADLTGATLKAKSKEVLGTCVSMRVRVEGNWAREVCQAVDSGDYDDLF